jgi:photosystem II stability/assembly factor-like uncharacterized protein
MASILLLVGTAKGIFAYRTDADRKSWTMSGPFLPGWEVYSVLRDGRGRWIAGTSHYAYGATFRVSDNDGESWDQLPSRPEYDKESGFQMKRIWQIEQHPSEPDTLFAGVEDASLFVSRDRGGSWQELTGLTRTEGRKNWFPGGGGLCLHTILVEPKNPQNLYVGISAVGVFRSRDGGVTWTNHNHSLSKLPTGSPDIESACCVHKMVLDPTTSGRLFMQYHGGVYVSTDAAVTWTRIENGLPSNFGFPMVITHKGELFVVPLISDEQRMFGGEQMRVFKSTDAGQSWQPKTSGLPASSFSSVLRDAMAVDSMPTPGVYLGTTSGEVFASADAGESWQRLPGTLPRVTSVRAYMV